MLSPDQFTEWAEYARLEPWGFQVEDRRFAETLTAIFRAAGAKDVKPLDFSMRQDLGGDVVEDDRLFAEEFARALGAKPE